MAFFVECEPAPAEIVFIITQNTSALIETLLQPFVEGELEVEKPVFFIRSEASGLLDEFWKADELTCEQTLKNESVALEKAGFDAVTGIEGAFPMGLCLMTKHKKENYGNVARALRHIKTGGYLVCAGSNAIGVKSIEKNVAKQLPVSGKISKNHCRVFWIEKTEGMEASFPAEWEAFSQAGSHIPEESYITQPGIFSWNKVDKGSAYLVEHFPKTIKGKVADFGAGWGYLSVQLIQRFKERITSLDLYENEWLALEAARKNLTDVPESTGLRFHWSDLSKNPPQEKGFDWVVMNPPFHTSARTDVSLGYQFIANAAKALKRNGHLLMVANRQLPYEREIKEHFRSFERIVENREFKVILASHSCRS